MEKNKPDILVICSTLNQITNYLAIKEYKGAEIYNITFDERIKEVLNPNIKNSDWDRQLKKTLRKDKKIGEITDILLSEDDSDFFCIQDILERIGDKITIGDERSIYWHITGGQRIIAMAAAEFIRGRKKDKLIYVEGSTEQILVYSNTLMLEEHYAYCDETLNFKTIFNLTGFNYNEKAESTKVLNMKEECGDELKKEMRFYSSLYKIICGEPQEVLEIKTDGKCIKRTFRDHLICSNKIKNKNEDIKNEKQTYLLEVFQKLIKKHSVLKEYNIMESKELKMSVPAGYIFEKLVAYKIHEVIKSEKYNINEMALSIKPYFNTENTSNDTVDELDIAILSNAGKLYNFECKTGGMEGDNAKSHNYTTYRLSGVFGMPILISPLFETEITDKEKMKVFGNQAAAIRSAERAELEYWCIDTIEERMKKLLK